MTETEVARLGAELLWPTAFGLSMIGLLLALASWIGRRNRTVPDESTLWAGRQCRCPQCGKPMKPGWVLLGKGAIWTDRAAGRPGTFAHLGNVLPNTLGMRLKPAANMAWRCEDCRMLMIDHDKLVGG